MGKSLKDNPFNNLDNITSSLTGRTFSKEAVEENIKEQSIEEQIQEANIPTKENTDLAKLLSKAKIDIEKELENNKPLEEENLETLHHSLEELKTKYETLKDEEEERVKDQEAQQEEKKPIYIKKTMIFNEEYLKIIEALALHNDMQIKDVLNQLLKRAIEEVDQDLIKQSLKALDKKNKANRIENKSIF